MMKKDTKLRWKYFAMSFGVAFVLLAAAAFLFAVYLQPKGEDATGAAVEPVERPLVSNATQADSLTLFLIGRREAEQSPFLFTLVRFNPLKGEAAVASLPASTQITGDRTDSLSGLFRYAGAKYVTDTLSADLNIPIQGYILYNYREFIQMVDVLGQVELELEEELVLLDGENQREVRLEKGVQRLDGSRIFDMIQYGQSQQENPLEQAQLASQLTARLINQNLSRWDLETATSLLNAAETSLSLVDFQQRQAALSYLAQSGEEPARTVPVNGQVYQNSFVLSNNTRTLLAAAFR